LKPDFAKENTMKHTVRITILVAAALLLAAAAPHAPPTPRGFAGNWNAIDPDGSNLRLRFKSEPGSDGFVFEINLYDDRCSACEDAPAQGHGVGVLGEENQMQFSVAWWGLRWSDAIFGPFSDSFTYDPESDTVTDSFGIVYHRSKQGDG
jgi:hypothetical protein